MSSGSCFHAAASQAAGWGLNVLPVRPGTKIPAIPDWPRNATSDDLQLEAWSLDTPDFNIGVTTEKLIVIDDDCSEFFRANPDKRIELLRKCWGAVSTPRGGTHFYFRQPVGQRHGNTTGRIAPNVDTRADGGFVLFPGSCIDGKVYSWLPGYEPSGPIEQAKPPPIWVLKLLEETRPAVPIACEVAEGTIPEGGRNSALASFAGAMRRFGATEGELYAALAVRNQTQCVPPLGDSEVRQIARSVSRYEADQISTMIAEGGNEQSPEAVDDLPKDPGSFPSKLLEVPGFIGEFCEWTLSRAIRKQPELTLAAGLALLATLTGRKVVGSTGLRTNLYAIGLCDTGGGKECPRQALKEVLLLSGLSNMILMDDVVSEAGLRGRLAEQPCGVIPLDEIGKFLASTRGDRASPHAVGVINFLLKVFSMSGSSYSGAGRADTSKRCEIVNPHLVVYGTSVSKSVLEGFSEDSLTDGFVSRLLVFEAADNNPKAQRDVSIEPPPERVLEYAAWWGAFDPQKKTGTGNLSPTVPDPRLVADGPGVRQLFFDADERFRAKQRQELEGSAIWTRAVEKARKLALLYELSADRHATHVNREAAEWSLAVVEHLTDRVILLAHDWVADNKQGSLINKVVRLLRDNPGGLPHWKIVRSLQRKIPAREAGTILDTLLASRTIIRTEIPTDGRVATVYQLNGATTA